MKSLGLFKASWYRLNACSRKALITGRWYLRITAIKPSVTEQRPFRIVWLRWTDQIEKFFGPTEFTLALVNIIIGQHFPLAIIATFLANNLWYNRHWIIIKYVPFDNWKFPIIKKDRYLTKSQVSLSKNRQFLIILESFVKISKVLPIQTDLTGGVVRS